MDVRKVKLFIKSSQDIQQVTQRERTDEHGRELSLNRTQDYDNCTHQHSQKPDQRFERFGHVKPCLLDSQFICFHSNHLRKRLENQFVKIPHLVVGLCLG